ncbi:MAG: homocysteine S-methyltransferase family protein [Melioribacteraceae bacterium]|nr:homocysteine S-methyltransferase family protein [Melioribacteraceae bacterium]
MKSLLEEIKKGKILISDGAWGTFLQKKGLEPGECPEHWNIIKRDSVLEIAQSYINAGADIILTNSFGASPHKLKHYKLEDQAWEINKAAAEISREAASDKFVLGSVGPTGAILMMGDVSEEEIFNGFKLQAQALEKGGADAICIETMSDVHEAILAVKAAKEFTNLEIVCTFTFHSTVNGDYKTMMGVSPAEMTSALIEAGADIIGSNCGNGFEQMIDIVKDIRKVSKTIPILVHANAGKPLVEDNQTIFPETPQMMVDRVDALISCGANIIGGCCGTTPEHIRALSNKIKAL